MKRRIVEWRWENPDAQASFVEWLGFETPAHTRAQVQCILTLTGIEPASRVLDVGCGNGRHAILLAQMGFEVTGIDVATSYLDMAREDAQAAGIEICWRHQSGSQVHDIQAYDLVMAYNHTLGFMEPEELTRHLCQLAKSLKPTGVFLLRLAGPIGVAGISPPPERDWLEKQGRFIMSEKRYENGYRLETCVVVDTNTEEIIEYRERQRAYTIPEIIRQLEGAGLEIIRRCADLDGSPGDDTTTRVLLCTATQGIAT